MQKPLETITLKDEPFLVRISIENYDDESSLAENAWRDAQTEEAYERYVKTTQLFEEYSEAINYEDFDGRMQEFHERFAVLGVTDDEYQNWKYQRTSSDDIPF
jgi:hypothetical protein